MKIAVFVVALLAACVSIAGAPLTEAASAPSGQALALPASAFGAAKLLAHSEHVLTKTDPAIAQPTFFPRSFHASPYSTWHWQAGYIQAAHLAIPGTRAVVTFDSVASLFLRTRGANKAWKDGSSYYPIDHPNASASPCQAGKGVSCTSLLYRSKRGFTWQIMMLQQQRCLFEMRGLSPTRLYAREKAVIAQTLLLMQGAAVQVGKEQACAEAPATPTFTFVSLAALNAKGHQQKTFSPKDTILIRLTYTASNLPRHTDGTIKRTFEYYDTKTRKWTAMGHPVSETSNSIANGTHFIQYTYVPLPLGAQQRIVVDLTIASHTQERTVYLRINGR
jgi:hypothetical protein